MRKTDLLKNIEVLKQKHNIQFNTELLYKIGVLMGKSKPEARIFAEKEKSNFTKILKGERPLNYNYIIPLEEIFGVPLAKIQNPQKYLDLASVNKDDIPYLKSFRYYAYKDEYELWDELYSTLTDDGYSVIEESDEYRKTIFDYMIEYNSYKGLKYFVEKHNLRFIDNLYYYDDHSIAVISSDVYGIKQQARFAEFIINYNNDDIFNKVFNPNIYLLKMGEITESIYKDDIFIEALINSDKIFNSLFEIKTYKFNDINSGVVGKEEEIITTVSPLLNISLDFCLKNIETYKVQAKKIIEFGLKYNVSSLNKVIDLPGQDNISKLGFIQFRYVIYGNVIYPTIKTTTDLEINQLLNKLFETTNRLIESKK